MTQAPTTPAQVGELKMEIPIQAPVATVWAALVEDTSAWWHKDFYTGADPVGFHLEPKLGGWMYEDWGDGCGLIWGTVIGVRTPDLGDPSLTVISDSSPEWGGPNSGVMSWKLSAPEGAPEETVVHVSYAIHGKISAESFQSIDNGWRFLFNDCLRPYAEGKAGTAS